MPWLRCPASALLVVGVVVSGFVAGCGNGGVETGPLTGTIASAGEADEGIDGVVAYRVESNQHTTGEVTYSLLPPPGGPHHPVYANCGFYDEAIADEHVVHGLEHGVVWLAYSPALSATHVERVRDLARAHKVIATPYANLPAGAVVVASAWARQLVLESADDPRLDRFVVQYQDGSQAPEAGGSCTGSPIGEPIT